MPPWRSQGAFRPAPKAKIALFAAPQTKKKTESLLVLEVFTPKAPYYPGGHPGWLGMLVFCYPLHKKGQQNFSYSQKKVNQKIFMSGVFPKKGQPICALEPLRAPLASGPPDLGAPFSCASPHERNPGYVPVYLHTLGRFILTELNYIQVFGIISVPWNVNIKTMLFLSHKNCFFGLAGLEK